MFRRNAIVATLSLSAVGLLSAGCEEDEKATPQVVFEARLEGGGSGNDCREVGPLFNIGEFGNPALDDEEQRKAKPIPDGQSFKGQPVAVSCTVSPLGTNEFNVAGSVLLSGAEGGLFRIDGKFTATADANGIPGIHAIFSKRLSGNTYEQVDRQCVVRYTSSVQGVAAGRVWGEITCPKVENSSAQTSCEAIAQFRFENCGQ